MRNCTVILKKQLKDTLKNKVTLIQFIMFPVLTLVMENAITLDGMPELFFTKLFSVMYIGMAPVTSTAAIIAEEKEKNTLRVLMMANVTPWQYLLGVGFYVWSVCMIGAVVMGTGFPPDQIPFYMMIMAIGLMISVFVGACVGILAKNEMTATSLVVPVMMLLPFLPMLAMFNDKIKIVSRVFYTRQLQMLLEHMAFDGAKVADTFILSGNAILMLVVFILSFRQRGLE